MMSVLRSKRLRTLLLTTLAIGCVNADRPGNTTPVKPRVQSPLEQHLAEVGPDFSPSTDISRLAQNGGVTRAYAMERLAEAGTDVVPLLVQALASDNVNIRRGTAEVLGRIGPDAAKKAAIPLRKLFNDSDNLVRACAAYALARLHKPESALAGSAFTQCLSHENDWVRSKAVSLLVELGPEAKCCVAPLIAALKDPLIAHSAAWALMRFGPGAKASAPALAEAATSSSPMLRETALRALGYIGVAPAFIEPVLTEALQDPQPRVRETAAEMLRRLSTTDN